MGILFGVAAMLAFGIQDFIMAKISRSMGAFRTSFWFQVVVLILEVILALFFFKYAGIQIMTIGILVLTALFGVIGLVAFNKGFEVGNVSIVTTIFQLGVQSQQS